MHSYHCMARDGKDILHVHSKIYRITLLNRQHRVHWDVKYRENAGHLASRNHSQVDMQGTEKLPPRGLSDIYVIGEGLIIVQGGLGEI